MAADNVTVASDPANDLVLLERVFLRLGSVDTDAQLQKCIGNFLTPVLLKLASPHEQVRKKVMELLLHINKRVRSRPNVQLPIDALLQQYSDSRATSFVLNFSIIYVTMGFPRLTLERQLELIPTLLSAIATRSQPHQDVIMLMIMPILGNVGNKAELLKLKDRPEQTKSLLNLLQDVLILPYWAVPASKNIGSEAQIPPGMNETSYKRVTEKNNLTPEELEKNKQSIVKFLSTDVFEDKDILLSFIIGAADTHSNVSSIASLALGKISSSVDWSTSEVCKPLYDLFLGKSSSGAALTPTCTRIRLKLLQYLSRATRGGILFPDCIDMLCSSLDSANSNPRLKTLSLNFSSNIISSEDFEALKKYGPILLQKFVKITEEEAEHAHHAQAYTCIGKVASKIPIAISEHFKTIENLFNTMPNAAPELRLSIREALLALANAFRNMPESKSEPMDVSPAKTKSSENEEVPEKEESNITKINSYLDESQRMIIIALLEKYMDDDDPMVRFVATRYSSVLFPNDHIASKYLLLLASGDIKDEVRTDAIRSLYGTSRSSEIDDIVQNMVITDNKPIKPDEAPKTDKKFYDSEEDANEFITVPPFEGMVEYIWSKILKRKESSNLKHRFVTGNQVLPFPPNTYFEILRYLKMCLNREAGIVNGVPHPSVSSPILSSHISDKLMGKESLEHFLNMIKLILISNPDAIPFGCLLDIVGCAPTSVSKQFVDQLPFFQNQFVSNTRDEIRDPAAMLYAIVKVNTSSKSVIESDISELIEKCKNNKSLESQCGLMSAYTYLLERYITTEKNSSNNLNIVEWAPYKNGIKFIVECLSSTQNMLITTSCKSIALLGKCYALPLVNKNESDSDNLDNNEKISEKTSDEQMSKLGVINKLFSILKNAKYTSKIKERATTALGCLAVGEKFPFTNNIIKGFLNMANETKDFEIHLQIGESLVLCVDGVNSPENRNIWTEPLPDEKTPAKDNDALLENDKNLDWLLTELLTFLNITHPNTRQAGCIWLLALVKHCANRKPIQSRLSTLQLAFMEYLSENNDLVQDVASKGLSSIYQCSSESDKKELVDKLVDQLAGGKKRVTQVTEDTKIFEDGQLGKTPTGANLTTYKELCSFASDLNQPDLIYKFMHLANHNSMWNSKKGAAFGFHSIAQQAGTQLSEHLPKIVPRLYRYRFDPTPKIQNSMSSIWQALVTDTQKTVEKYQSEILKDLILNLTGNQWRIRLSCCLALSDLIRVTRGFDENLLEELWEKLFRVMDDVHEGTRTAAESTTNVLSKYCIRITDASQGKSGKKVMGVILPVLLNTGITNTVAEVRKISLQTVSKLVTSAGESLKPFLPQLIPALLQATGDLESSKLSQLSTMLGERQQAQEMVDSVRAQAAKSHYANETVSKCIQYIDTPTFETMLPNVLELMKSPQLGTKVACTHLFACITLHLGKDIMPMANKMLFSLVNGLVDRNTAVRKHCSDTIGIIVGYAKSSSVDKLLKKLCMWYNERDEESVRNAIALTFQAIANKNGELLKEKSNMIVPMLFFAMHAEKTPESKVTVELYEEIWSEIIPSKELGIRKHLPQICECLKESINLPSWTVKTQAGNAIATVALEMKTGLGPHRQQLVLILLNSIKGSAWEGKQKLLQPLASLCSYKDDEEKLSPEILKQIVDTILRECKKNDPVYKRYSLSALGDILEVLKIDSFEEVYNVLSDTLTKDVNKIDKDSDDDDNEEFIKKQEQYLLLKEVAYETLGKAWPNNYESQQKYQRIFAKHCSECLQSTTRTIQVAILTALKFYIEKLCILNADPYATTDPNVEKMEVDSMEKVSEDLPFIISDIIVSLDYSLGVAKNIKLRKEAMNILNTLGKRLTESKKTAEIEKLKQLYLKHEAELAKDNAPEVRSRLVHIKLLFQ